MCNYLPESSILISSDQRTIDGQQFAPFQPASWSCNPFQSCVGLQTCSCHPLWFSPMVMFYRLFYSTQSSFTHSNTFIQALFSMPKCFLFNIHTFSHSNDHIGVQLKVQYLARRTEPPTFILVDDLCLPPELQPPIRSICNWFFPTQPQSQSAGAQILAGLYGIE